LLQLSLSLTNQKVAALMALAQELVQEPLELYQKVLRSPLPEQQKRYNQLQLTFAF
jgi:hypothetical protein